MKFFITFMLVLLLTAITGLSSYVLHLDQGEKITGILDRLSIVEKRDDGKAERQALAKKINNLEDRLDLNDQEINEIERKIMKDIEQTIKRNRIDLNAIVQELKLYCIASPESTTCGTKRYPINENKYGQIGLCGELFTADDCGLERLAQISGVNQEGTLAKSISITLNEKPSYGLRINLERLGFEPGKACVNLVDKNCTSWKSTEALNRSNLKKLKAYAREIRYCEI